MPFPTYDQVVSSFSVHPLLGFDEGAHRLVNSELDAVYQAFVDTVKSHFVEENMQLAAWAKFLLILANAGFASSLQFNNRLLKVVDKEGKATTGPGLADIVLKLSAATPSYSHQRLACSIPDVIYRVIKESGRMTVWGSKNGLRLHDFGFSFPCAYLCLKVRPDDHDLRALSVGRSVALSSAVEDTISTALPAAMIQLTNAPSAPTGALGPPSLVL